MKRLTTRVLILALVGFLAAGGIAFGDEQNPAIELSAQTTIDLTKALTEASSHTYAGPGLSLKWAGAASAHSTFEAKLIVANAASGAGAVTGQGHFVIDLISALGVDAPVGATLKLGNSAFEDLGYGKVTSQGLENVSTNKVEGATIGLTVTADPGITIGFGTLNDFSKSQIHGGVVVDIVRVGGFLALDSSDMGFGVDADLASVVGLPVNVGVEVEIKGSDSTLDYGVGVKADLGAAVIGASVNTATGTLTYIGGDVAIPLGAITAKVDVKYDIATSDAAKALNGLGIDLDFGAFDAGIDLRSAGANVQNLYLKYTVSL